MTNRGINSTKKLILSLARGPEGECRTIRAHVLGWTEQGAQREGLPFVGAEVMAERALLEMPHNVGRDRETCLLHQPVSASASLG